MPIKRLPKREAFFYLINPSPDGSGILLLASLARKRYSGQQEQAPENYFEL
jgi:hypothetical protein